MAKIMKRTWMLSNRSPIGTVRVGERIEGFGVRVKPSGVKTFLIQYRNIEGRTRRSVLGQYGALAPMLARPGPRQLTAVVKGEDPSPRAPRCARRHIRHRGLRLVSERPSQRILGRNRRPIKATTLQMDRSRIEKHIKPLLGPRLVDGLPNDIEGMQADIAAGKSARNRKKGRGGIRPAAQALRAELLARCEVCSVTPPPKTSSAKTQPSECASLRSNAGTGD